MNLASSSAQSVTVIIPTYREAPNLPHLLSRLAAVREREALDMQVLIMDDRSQDGSVQAVEAFGAPWVQLVERQGPRGLSLAVVDGLRRATKDVVVVMDGDLSHPPEAIPALLETLERGHDFALGSRYVRGGSTDDDWGFIRWLNSRIATVLSRPLTRALDPMSGFFAMRRDQLNLQALDPIGYKIGLELMVKCQVRSLAEIPIHFTDRVRGESKLSLKEQLLYLRHLRRLYIYHVTAWAEFLQFAAVGASGVLVNLVALSIAVALGVPRKLAIALAIGISMASNFALNRRFTFSYARDQNILRQFAGFVSASIVGAGVNYGVTLALAGQWPAVPIQLHACGGVLAGLGFNFLANRFLVFRKRHVKPRATSQRPPLT